MALLDLSRRQTSHESQRELQARSGKGKRELTTLDHLAHEIAEKISPQSPLDPLVVADLGELYAVC